LALYALFGFGAAAAGQIWLAAQAPNLNHETAVSLAAVLPVILVLSLSTSAVLFAVWRMARGNSGLVALAVMIAAGLAMRLVWFGSPAPIEDDYYRYLWDGALLANGFNPYDLAPKDVLTAFGTGGLDPSLAAIAAEGQETLSRINFPGLKTIYPGAAQAAFALAYWIAPWSLDALRLVFLVADTATLLLSILILLRIGASLLWAGLYWCNPLASAMLIGAAHADVLVAPFILAALLLAMAGRSGAGGAALGLAAGVKLWPALLLPLLLRAGPKKSAQLAKAAAAFFIVGAAAIVPLALASLDPQSGLAAYAGGWANNNAVFAWLREAAYALTQHPGAERFLRLSLAAAAGAIALAMAMRPISGPRDLCARAAIIAAAVFFCSPAQFPWYASWFLPLAAIAQNWPLLAVSALLPAYYLFFPSWGTPFFPYFAFGAAFIHWLPLLAPLTQGPRQLPQSEQPPARAA
jgi:hypothetical protein